MPRHDLLRISPVCRFFKNLRLLCYLTRICNSVRSDTYASDLVTNGLLLKGIGGSQLEREATDSIEKYLDPSCYRRIQAGPYYVGSEEKREERLKGFSS